MSIDTNSPRHIKRKQYAIVIGINSHDDEDHNLNGPKHDAMLLTQALENKKIANFNVNLVINSTSQQILQELEKVCSVVEKEDTLLFYFSGHGHMLDGKNDLYMMASDSKLDRVRSTCLSAYFVNELMSSTHCKNQIMVLDCCHAGAFARSLRGESIHGRRIIMAAAPEQGLAQEVASRRGHTVGVFTHAFIHGITSGAADLNKDGFISALELYQYCQQTIQKSKKYSQESSLWAFGVTDDIVITRNPQVNDEDDIFDEFHT